MERIDLFVKVIVSLKDTSPLLVLEDLTEEGSDAGHSGNMRSGQGQDHRVKSLCAGAW